MQQVIKELKPYKKAIEIFSLFKDETDAVILDSSLENSLGRYTIIGRRPYLKLVKGREFTINGRKATVTFEQFLKEYLTRASPGKSH